MGQEKNLKIINMRALAIIIVVFGHSIILYDPCWNIYSSQNVSTVLENIKHFINIIQMPLFFWVSGFCFFYSTKKNKKFVSLAKNKCIRLLIPFFIVALFWVIPLRSFAHYSEWENLNIFDIMMRIFIGKDSAHLWYLGCLFEIFLINFGINRLINPQNKYLNFFIYFIFIVLQLKPSLLPNFLFLQSTAKYLFWFRFGYDINKNIDKLLALKNKIGILFFSLSVILGIIYLCEIIKIKLVNKILELIIGILWCMGLYSIIPNVQNKVFSYISKNSFGIYLFHSPMIYPIFYYLRNYRIAFIVFLNSVILFAISVLLTEVIRKTKFKFAIGE